MSIHFPVELSIDPATDPAIRGFSRLTNGELLLGKVTRVAPDGTVSIRFPGFEARSQTGGHFQAGRQVFAYVQKTHDDTLLALLPTVEDGDILTGTVVEATRSDGIARFERSDLRVQLPSPDSSMPAVGTPIRAQVRVLAGKPVLQMLPQEVSTADPGSPTESGGPSTFEELVGKVVAEPQYASLLDRLLSGELRIDGVSRELLALLQRLIQEAETGKSAWASTLVGAMKTILLTPQEGTFPEQLETAFTNSGIFLESRLLQAALSEGTDSTVGGDLKLALLLANQKLSQVPPPPGKEGGEPASYLPDIAAKVGRLLNGVNAEQLQNLRILPSDQVYIQLPFAEGTDLDHVQIRISHRGKRAARKYDPRNAFIAIVVTTSKLGRIRASLSIVDGQVSCQFKATRKPVIDLFADNADLLKHGLEKLNYRVASISCMISNEERDYSIIDEPAAASPTGLDMHA